MGGRTLLGGPYTFGWGRTLLGGSSIFEKLKSIFSLTTFLRVPETFGREARKSFATKAKNFRNKSSSNC